MWAIIKISGRLSPRSHLPTACWLTLSFCANCACEKPDFLRASAMRIPTILVLSIIIYELQLQPQLHSGVHLHSVGVQPQLVQLQAGQTHVLFIIV